MKAAKVIQVECSDWHRTWGLGTNKIGKLSRGDSPGTYVWTGHQQGRHGQVYMRRHSIVFREMPEGSLERFEIITNEKDGRLPDYRDIDKAITELNHLFNK